VHYSGHVRPSLEDRRVDRPFSMDVLLASEAVAREVEQDEAICGHLVHSDAAWLHPKVARIWQPAGNMPVDRIAVAGGCKYAARDGDVSLELLLAGVYGVCDRSAARMR
jgi:hypothetical protein